MKRSNILLATSTVALLATGCAKPTQDPQAIYDPAQSTYGTEQQSGTYQDATYNPSAPGIIYEGTQTDDNPEITTGAVGAATTYPDTTYGSTASATTYPDTTYGSSSSSTTTSYPTYGSSTASTATTYPGTIYGSSSSTATTYPDPYASSSSSTTSTTYPDPYASSSTTSTTYPDPYASSSTTSTTYPDPYVTTRYPATTSSSAGHSGGIELQIAALKNYYTAKEYVNRLSLPPGLSAYVKRGAMNKVIITGISSVAEANRLKENRFPGAFIVHGGGASEGGYTPSSTHSSITYTVNNPYGTSSSTYATSGNSGIGVQIGAFSSRAKARALANSQTGRYPATVKKIGGLYKVILTGFSSRSAAKSYAKRVGGFVVSSY